MSLTPTRLHLMTTMTTMTTAASLMILLVTVCCASSSLAFLFGVMASLAAFEYRDQAAFEYPLWRHGYLDLDGWVGGWMDGWMDGWIDR